DFTSHAQETKSLRSNRISDKDISAKETIFINYLELALEIEKHLESYIPDPWSYGESEKKKNPVEYNRLIEKTKQMLSVAQHATIKERLAFQLIKLHRYEENYQEVVNTFEKYFANTNSFIGYWAMDHYAGALKNMGRKPEANYNFAKVYVNSPSRRESAYLSITINSDEEMNDVKNLCKSTDEKLALHFIRGVESKTLSLGDIEYITKNGGNHEYARVLMSYEINKIERILLNNYSSSYYEDAEKEKLEATNYLQQLIELNKQILAIDDTSKFWHISLAYLHFINKDHISCKNILEAHKPNSRDLKIQHTVIEILNYVASHEELTVTDENILGHKLYEINNNKETLASIPSSENKVDFYSHYSSNYYLLGGSDYNTINEYLFKLILAKVKNKNSFKELIFNGSTIESDLYRRDFPEWNETQQGNKKLTIEYIDDLLAAYDLTEKTKLIEFAGKYYFEFDYNSYNGYYYNYNQDFGIDNRYFSLEKSADIKSVLLELKATLLMRNPDKLNEAIAIFEKLPENINNASMNYKNPFEMSAKTIRFNENVEIDYSNSLTKLQLAKKLQMHYEKGKATNSAIDYFNLGVAYYNISYYSNSWDFLAYYRCTMEPNGFIDNSIALNFLNKALSSGLRDRELEAKAHFMASRCELNLFTQRYGGIGDNSENEPYFDNFMSEINRQGFQKNFAALKNSYYNTQFYRDIVSECRYFYFYIN
ncbi:MAG: hypothetical protein ACKO7P_15255, partial [Bacteroidota bacterium]